MSKWGRIYFENLNICPELMPVSLKIRPFPSILRHLYKKYALLADFPVFGVYRSRDFNIDFQNGDSR